MLVHVGCEWSALAGVKMCAPGIATAPLTVCNLTTLVYLLCLLVQSVLCMISFFTIFWWYGVPLSMVYNHGTEYWMDPGSGRDLSFDCW